MLTNGTVLGPYRISAPLGAGGMGEVYRACDTRLGRDVALKVISAGLAGDAARIRRFEQEARAAGALNHPNVCAIFDLGTHEGSPFVVMELLEGDSLRARLKQGPIPVRKAIDWAAQAAHGLAAAHEKGIVHRDLKPENLFLTKDGRVKVLDFGLAKLTRPDLLAPAGEDTLTVAATATGAIMGTAGYMAPEQVRGEATDQRTDLFALGAILYELLTGQRAFAGATFYETSHRILNEEPPPLDAADRELPPGLEAIVRRCLEKNSEERFQSAKDLAFALESMGGTEMPAARRGAPGPSPRRFARWLLVGGLLGAVLLAAGLETSRRLSSPSQPTFRKLSFGRGFISSARLTPDGNTVLYSARWEDQDAGLFSTRVDMPRETPIVPANARVVDIRGGEAAVLLTPPTGSNSRRLATIPLGGGTPRPIRDGVVAANWSPDGQDFAVVTSADGVDRLEYPSGTVLFEDAGSLGMPCVSPRGDQVAFTKWTGVDHAVMVVDRSRRAKVLSGGWNLGGGGTLAWSPDGAEVWFCGGRLWGVAGLHAVTLAGKSRTVFQGPTLLALWDVSRDGRVLLTSAAPRVDIWGCAPGDTTERSWSWLDGGIAVGASADGSCLLFTECAAGGGVGYSAYFRRFDGSLPIRLGDGIAIALSPDGAWAVIAAPSDTNLTLTPTGSGEPRALSRGSVVRPGNAHFFPGLKRILIVGNEAGRPSRLFVQDLDGGDPRPFSAEGVSLPALAMAFSPDGTRILAIAEGRPALLPATGGEARPIEGLLPSDSPVAWSLDGKSLFVVESRNPVVRVVLFDLASRTRVLWRELRPREPAGGLVSYNPVIAKGGEVYFYTVAHVLHDLFLVDGLR